MYQYFKQEIEPLNDELGRKLGIKTIVVKYQPSDEQVHVLTTGEVYAREAIREHQLEEMGL